MRLVDKAQVAKGRVLAYFRWSSDQQEKGNSLTRQTGSAETWCKREGVRLADTFVDEGISARFGKNKEGELGRLLAAIRPGDTVLVEDADRLTRQGWYEGSKLLHDITSRGARLVTLDQNKELNAENCGNLADVLGFLVKSDGGHQENAKRIKRITEAMEAKRHNLEQGRATFGRLPAWLAWNYPARPRRDDRKPVVLADKAALVRKVFALCLEGKGVHQIEHAMREHPPIANSKKADWNTRFIHRLLTDRAVLGYHAASEKPVYPAIVDADTFHAAKAKLSLRRVWTVRKSVENSNLFTKIARCAECGSPLVKQSTKAKGQTYSYLMCNGAIRHKTECGGGSLRYGVFEENLLGLLTQEADIRAALTGEAPGPCKLDVLNGELTGIHREQNKLMTMIDGMDTPPRQLAEKLNALNARETALQDEIEIETAKAKFATPPLKAYEAWRAGQPVPTVEIHRAKVRLLLRDIVDRIEVKLGQDEYAVYFKGGRKPFGVQIWSAE